MADIVKIIDFAADDTVPEFMVGPDYFKCVPDIPLSIMQKVAQFKQLQKDLQETGDLEPILSLFDELLDFESAPLFRQRVAERQIGIRRIMKILPWIMEEFGLGHPTQPSSPSSSGSSGDGIGASSTDGVLPGVLMLGGSAPETH